MENAQQFIGWNKRQIEVYNRKKTDAQKIVYMNKVNADAKKDKLVSAMKQAKANMPEEEKSDVIKSQIAEDKVKAPAVQKQFKQVVEKTYIQKGNRNVIDKITKYKVFKNEDGTEEVISDEKEKQMLQEMKDKKISSEAKVATTSETQK